jgi:hypothetical protein
MGLGSRDCLKYMPDASFHGGFRRERADLSLILGPSSCCARMPLPEPQLT